MPRQLKCTVVNQEDARNYSEIPSDGDWYVVQLLQSIQLRRQANTVAYEFETRNEAQPPYIPNTDRGFGSSRISFR